jgi:outer membrane protein assembly factor BamB
MKRTTLLRLGVAALLGLGGLALFNSSAAQEVKQTQLPGQPDLQPVPKIQIAQPPNGQPIQVAPGLPGGGPKGNFVPGGGPVPGGKFNGPIPSATAPVAFTSKEGKTGWKVMIPGNRPLATPAVVDGKIFIGGGFGSYEFYCLDAKSGKQNWVYRTGDDGPTAAVVSDGYVAFNTESCEIEILTYEGKQVWKKWLGDPLMSMPAIANGKVYMSYPGAGKHLLGCYDLKTGQSLWTKDLPSQIVTAPIISQGNLYATTLDGSMTCFGLNDGKLVWQEKKNATSAPVVWNGDVYFSRRDNFKMTEADGKVVEQQTEAIAAKGKDPTSVTKDLPSTKQNADYLDYDKRLKLSQLESGYKKNDASVGFGSAPGGAGLGGGKANIGQTTVNGVWAYQGSKPFIYNNQLYTSMGDCIKCVDPKTEKVTWQKDLKHPTAKGPVVDACLTPPAIVNGKLFMGTSAGQVICMSATTGETLWTATVEGSISFQPAVAHGMVYVSTNNGGLFAFDTGDANDHGWLMWGANAQHNGGID